MTDMQPAHVNTMTGQEIGPLEPVKSLTTYAHVTTAPQPDVDRLLDQLCEPFALDDVALLNANRKGESLDSRKYPYISNRAIRRRLRGMRSAGVRHRVEVVSLVEKAKPAADRHAYVCVVRLHIYWPNGEHEMQDGTGEGSMIDGNSAAKAAASRALVVAAREFGVGDELENCRNLDARLIERYHRAGDVTETITSDDRWQIIRDHAEACGKPLADRKHQRIDLYLDPYDKATGQLAVGDDGKFIVPRALDKKGRMATSDAAEQARRLDLVTRFLASRNLVLNEMDDASWRALIREVCAEHYYNRRGLTHAAPSTLRLAA